MASKESANRSERLVTIFNHTLDRILVARKGLQENMTDHSRFTRASDRSGYSHISHMTH